MFELARRLKAIPELADLPAKELRPIVREWHRRGLPFMGTKDWETSWFDFSDGWSRVRVPGAGAVEDALERAKAGPLPAAAMEYDNPKLRLLVGLCRELQRHVGDGPFFLSCQMGARVLGDGSDPSPMTVWRWLSGLLRDGVLAPGKKGDRRRANEYRYLAEM